MSVFRSPVAHYMSWPVYAIGQDEPLEAAQDRLLELGVTALSVVDEHERSVGVITRTDLLQIGRVASAGFDQPLIELPDKPVASVMATDLKAVNPAETLVRAAEVMVESRVHRVFVLDAEGRVAGVISARDLMRAIAEERIRTPIGAFLSRPALTIDVRQPVRSAHAQLLEARVTSLVVVDDGWPVGLFGQDEALGSRHFEAETPVEAVMADAVVALDAATPLHVAAAEVAGSEVRLLVGLEDGRLAGVLGGLDFARVVQTDAATSPERDLACPRDGALLTHTLYAVDVEVQVCPRCRGLWLERDSLIRLEGEPPAVEVVTPPADVERAFAVARERKEATPACPRCARRMERREYAYCSQILIDGCPHCRGVWLDGGELDAIERFLLTTRQTAQEAATGFFHRMLTTII